MKKKLIKLEDFYVLKLSLESVSKTDDFDLGIDQHPMIDYEILMNESQDDLLAMQLSVLTARTAHAERPGLMVEAKIFGIFSFDPLATEDEKQYLIRLNGATILYGLIRGLAATAAGAFPGGKFMLPSVFMNEVVAEVEKRKGQKFTDAPAAVPARQSAAKSRTKKPAGKPTNPRKKPA